MLCGSYTEFCSFHRNIPLLQKCAILVQQTIYHMLGFCFSHHIMFSPSTYPTIHWSQPSFLRKALKGLKNHHKVFIKKRLFLCAEIRQQGAPDDLILWLEIAAAIARRKRQSCLPKNPASLKWIQEGWRILLICQVLALILEYLLQKSPSNVDFISQMPWYNPNPGTYAWLFSFLPV